MKFRILISIIIVFALSFVFFSPVFSQSVDDLENQLDQKNQEVKDKQNALSAMQKEIDAINSSSASLSQRISLTDTALKKVESYLSQTKKDLDKREGEYKKKDLIVRVLETQLNTLTSVLYKTSRGSFLEYFFLSDSSESFAKKIFYKQYLLSKQINEFKLKKQEMGEMAQQKMDLETEKKELGQQMTQLEKMKKDLEDERIVYLAQSREKSSQSSALKKQITLLKEDISDLQVAILTAKSGSTTGIGNVPSSGDYNATYAGFMEKAPSGSFDVFSFGAYTHRLGMSQYGAQARATVGKQNYVQILKAYYGKEPVKRNTSGTIKVEGYGSMDFETKYLYGIAEMPSDWSLEALKSQAVAARTYAYNYYYNKTTICITQSCQVWSKDKWQNVINGQAPNWKKAVDDTKGMILSGVTTYYSATSGGYLTTSGWDTTDGKGGGSGWTTNAWESKANSPWFYKAWYKDLSGRSCGRLPWLNELEMTDILNAYLVVKGIDLKGTVNTSKILPTTIKTCPIDGFSGNPYSITELRNLLNNPVVSISGNPVVTNDSKGNTTRVSFVTNRGALNISGSDFKQIYNMRAPGLLSIPQNNYVFINVVRK